MTTIAIITAFVITVSATALLLIVGFAFAAIDDTDEALRVFGWAFICAVVSVGLWWLL